MRWAGVLAFACFSAASISSRADDKSDCVSAYSNAQDLRRATKLRAAKEQLVVCGRSVCPAFITRECTAWMGEVEASMPTVVFAAKDVQGRDVLEARVLVDGKPFADRLDGAAIEIDPGTHAIEFRREGQPPLAETIVVRMGEKNRAVVVNFAPVEVPTRSERARPLVTAGIVFGVVGAIGLVTGTATGIAALATKDSQCSVGVCKAGTLSTLWAESTVSTTLLIAGGVLLAAGVALFVVGHKTHPKAAWLTGEWVSRF